MKRVIILASCLAVLTIGLVVWWSQESRQNPSLQKQSISVTDDKAYSISEVAGHSTRNDCWTTISGSVYDLTPYINRHPGGDEVIRACGQDATTLFTERRTKEGLSVGSGSPHSQVASEQLQTLKIGHILK